MFRGQGQADMMRCQEMGRLELGAILLPRGHVVNSDWPSKHRAFYKVAYDVRSSDVDLLD